MTTPDSQAIIDALIKNNRSDRFWRNFRFGLRLLISLFLLLVAIGFAFTGSDDANDFDDSKPYVAVVPLQGDVAAGAPFSARRANPLIHQAFEDEDAKAVILMINSPGGSPVQASEIYNQIRREKQLHPNTPVVAVGEDMLTSAAYLVASATDNIYVNESTITGSIGVVSSGFGFTKAISKLGIERRVFTSGVNKARLDPFKPLAQQDTSKMEHMLKEVHKNFISAVKKGRGKRLHIEEKSLFTGDFWTGKQAVKLGLVDNTLDLEDVMKKFDVDQYKLYSLKPSMLQQLMHNMGEEATVRLQSKANRLHAEF